MSESAFNKDFRKKLKEQANILIFRVESHSTSPGIPDNHFICGEDAKVAGRVWAGETGWIEMKEEVGTPFRVDYRPAQVPWLIQYAKNGGRCFTAIHITSTRHLLLIPGRYSQLASSNLRLAAHWVFDLDKKDVWEEIAGKLRAPVGIQPPAGRTVPA